MMSDRPPAYEEFEFRLKAMNSQEQTLSIFITLPEMLRLAKMNSEILKQYLKDHGTASLKLGGDQDTEITLPDSILRLICEALDSVAAGKRVRMVRFVAANIKHRARANRVGVRKISSGFGQIVPVGMSHDLPHFPPNS